MSLRLFPFNMKNFTAKISFLAVLLILTAVSFTTAQETVDTSQAAMDSLNLIPPNVTPVMAKNITVRDNPGDDGGSIQIQWDISVDDYDGGKVTAYRVMRSMEMDGEYTIVGDAPAGNNSFTDNATEDGLEYYYKIAAVNELKKDGTVLWSVMSESDPVGPVKSSPQWFDMQRINVFIGTVFCLRGDFLFHS